MRTCAKKLVLKTFLTIFHFLSFEVLHTCIVWKLEFSKIPLRVVQCFFFVLRVVLVYVWCFVGCQLNLWLLSQKSTTNFTFTIIFRRLYMNGAFFDLSVRVFFDLINPQVNVLPPCKISIYQQQHIILFSLALSLDYSKKLANGTL